MRNELCWNKLLKRRGLSHVFAFHQLLTDRRSRVVSLHREPSFEAGGNRVADLRLGDQWTQRHDPRISEISDSTGKGLGNGMR